MWNRREFLGTTMAGVGAPALAQQSAKELLARGLRVGFIGVGSRGSGLLRTAMSLGAEIPAVCDINEANLERALDGVQKTGRKRPEGYWKGPEDFLRLVARQDLDAVINAGPWEWHTPMSVATMKAGKYAAVEVPAALTLEECWQLVDTSEQTGMPCMMLENVCYFRNAMMVLNLIRHGLLGELLHCEGGYQHDVRAAFIGHDKRGVPGEITWRGVHTASKNGNLYPTHPIGPIGWWLDINRGDRFSYLVSMSTKSRGMNHYVAKKYGRDHHNAKRDYALGDVNTSLIRTENGATVTLYHDVVSPRPYDLILRAQGTEGIYSGTLDKIYVEDRSPKKETWEDPEAYYREFEHPLWKALGDEARYHGHGGADYITMHEFLKAVRLKTETPIDAYDTAAWSAIVPLSSRSVGSRSAAVDFPDFTRGKWKTRKPVQIVGI